MTIIILAAGAATRLRPITNEIPKCLLPVRGRSLLQRTLEAIAPTHPERIVIVGGFKADIVFRTATDLGLPLLLSFVLNPSFATTENTYSLWLASQSYPAMGDIMMLDGDILFEPELLRELVASAHPNCLLVKRSSDLGPEEVKVALDSEGRVLAVGKEIDLLPAIGESVGIERFSRDAARDLFAIVARRRRRKEYYEASFQELIDTGTAIHALECGDRVCIEIDTAEDLAAAEQLAGERGL